MRVDKQLQVSVGETENWPTPPFPPPKPNLSCKLVILNFGRRQRPDIDLGQKVCASADIFDKLLIGGE